MNEQVSKGYPQKWIQIGILLGFCLIVYFVNLGRWDLWKPDEPRYAQVAREMVAGGDWILMHLDGKMYTDKPPLFFWMIAFSSYLWQGLTSFSARFPSAFFGTLTVMLTFLIGRDLYSSRVGFLSGLILATSLEFAYLSIRANIDAMLTFFTTLALFCFIRFIRWFRHGAGDRGDRRGLYIYGLYIGMGLATLTKGPVGFILPLLVSIVYLMILKDWKAIRRMRLLPGLAVALAMVLSWYILAVLRGGQTYFEETVFLHTIDYYSKGWNHVKPFYFYLTTFPVDSVPWGLFFPVAVAYGFSEASREEKKEFLPLLIWFAVMFLFFSISKGKRNLYLLPLYPATSLMVGKLWDDYICRRLPPAWDRIVSWLYGGLMISGSVAGLAVLWLALKKPTFPLPHGLWVASFLIVVSILSIVLYRLRKYGILFLLLVLVVGGGFFYAQYAVFPMADQLGSGRAFFKDMRNEIKSGTFFNEKK